MTLLYLLDVVLAALNRAFYSPFAVFIQIQGCFICLTLALGWGFAAYVRNKNIQKMKCSMRKGNSFAFICDDINDLEHSAQLKLPRVSVVMPLKGFGEHNLQNWRSQITSLYGGPLEFLFVVESIDDPAYHAISMLISEYKDSVDAKIVEAGLSTTCSQKIHNQLKFKNTDAVLYILQKILVEQPSRLIIRNILSFHFTVMGSTAYVSDLAYYPTSMDKLWIQPKVWDYFMVGVGRMHKDSKYVLFLDDDVRLHPGSVGALVAEMEKNPDIFIQTGYPLDLPSGSLWSYCIYEYHMPCSMGFATGGKTFFLWGGCMMMHADDFRKDRHGVVSNLRDGGYSDDMTLAAIAGAHKRLITSPPAAIFPHPLASDLNFSRYWNYLRKQTFVLESYTSKVNWIMNRALFTSHCYLSWGFCWPYFMATIHVAAATRARYSDYTFEAMSISGGLILALCLTLCSFIEIVSVWNLTRVESLLCNMLSPEVPPISLASYNWGLVFVAMLVDNFLFPISAFRSHFTQCINWSGIQYHLKNGKLNKIERLKDPRYSYLGGKNLYEGKGCPPKASFLSSMVKNLQQWHQPKKYEN